MSLAPAVSWRTPAGRPGWEWAPGAGHPPTSSTVGAPAPGQAPGVGLEAETPPGPCPDPSLPGAPRLGPLWSIFAGRGFRETSTMEGRQKRAFLGGRASPARNPPYCLVWAQAPLWPPGEVLPLLILQEASGHCLLFGIDPTQSHRLRGQAGGIVHLLLSSPGERPGLLAPPCCRRHQGSLWPLME